MIKKLTDAAPRWAYNYCMFATDFDKAVSETVKREKKGLVDKCGSRVKEAYSAYL